MSQSHSAICPRCGATLPGDAPGGVCPRCIAAMNMATETVLIGADADAAQPPLSPAELAPHFPQFDMLECLGRGGMGVVYKARQKSLDRIVALKLLAPERAADGDFARRFETEAQALARLNHPNIVTVHDFGQAGKFFYLVMEFVDGLNVRQLLQTRKLNPDEALSIVPPVCEALQYAHEHGIVHRDIKPENLLLGKDGKVKIADFGIAKIMGVRGGEGSETRVAGTPQYMAPEQRAGSKSADHRADIYSLGVVLYEMLTGELPQDKLEPPSSRISGLKIDVRIDEIVLRAMEKQPEMRFQAAADFRTQVETIAARPGPATLQRDAERGASPVGDRPREPVRGAGQRVLGILLVIVAILLLGFIMVFLTYFASHRSGSEEQNLHAQPQREAQPDSTEIIRIKLGHAEKELSRLLSLESRQLVSAQEVSQAILNREVLRAELAGDKVKAAKVKVEYAEKELDRVQTLYKQNLVGAREVDQAIYSLNLLNAELRAAMREPLDSRAPAGTKKTQ